MASYFFGRAMAVILTIIAILVFWEDKSLLRFTIVLWSLLYMLSVIADEVMAIRMEAKVRRHGD